ncbi:hypothetical protein HF394_14710 [Planococcus glaciei]|uniref:Uncharacterized protein n=1 Tax=Planococcus glaciei TaxID=459472 RepID=A0A7H8QCI0_9BACL|nr:hypothetical protein [Planococcus glaciei]QKX51718.1 hypothetical protein HF394_14710 [Planococcus glaciei]
MKSIKNEKGYALVVVLLLIVLVLGISATFISGSLNNAKQEKTVDLSNQSVAAAEMGILYYSTDFERSLDQIKQEVLNQTRLELDKIVACLYAGNKDACDTSAERTAWEQNIDRQMKQLYVKKILIKINELIKINGTQTAPFTSTQSNYAPQTWKLMNVAYTPSELQTVSNVLVDRIVAKGKLEVKMDVKGTSMSSPKTLNSLFTVNIPASFLNKGEVYNVGQEIIAGKEDAAYQDVFKLTPPTQSCDALLTSVIAGTARAPFECKMTGDQKLATFIAKVTAAGKNPMDFWVHVDDFQRNVCTSNCNSIDFLGTNVVVKATDAGASSNMNNLVNGNLIINGTLTTGQNMNNLGKNMSKQTIVLKEMYIGGNIKNLFYTNLMILGKDTGEDSRLHVVGQFQIDNYTHLCMDIDRILPADLERLAATIEVTNSGRIIYYSAVGKTFALTGLDAANRTKLYVAKAASYGEFLNNCGIGIKSTQTVPISSPVVIDTDFDFEVDY